MGIATAEADPGRVEGAWGFNPARAGIESLISMQNHQILKKTIVSPLICMQMGKEIMRQQRHIHGRQQRQIHGRQQRQIQARSSVLGVLIRPGPE